MNEYVVNFVADVDVRVVADSPEAARRKAKELFGDYYEERFNYVCLSDINFITLTDGTEV